MTLKPCLTCGLPSAGPRCDEHTVTHTGGPRTSARTRGYNASWDRLSKRARRMQPFCTDCGATTDLQLDHSPQAWERHDAGLPIRPGIDAEVCCGPCNRARGAGRTRGNTPTHPKQDAPGLAAEGVTHCRGGGR